jgi:hydroxymethylglutaryl-CoA lyase
VATTPDIRSLAGQTVTVVEVGPRDGLQNEAAAITTADKIAFVDRLSDAGLPIIEVSAFVSPRWVPQMADAAEVFAGITRRPGVRYSALVPNLAGLERALRAEVSEIAIFASASETFSIRNINQSVDASMAVYREVSSRALTAALKVRAYLSTAFGCPYEGKVDVEAVRRRSLELLEMGAFEVAVSDTIGVAHPGQVAALLDTLLVEVPVERLALHLHDTRGTALANVLAALSSGIRTFDASAGGLGGCPFAPGAAGNLATEDLVYMLEGLGAITGVSLPQLSEATSYIAARIGHRLPSRYAQAAAARHEREG